jgi:hypothetical protein
MESREPDEGARAFPAPADPEFLAEAGYQEETGYQQAFPAKAEGPFFQEAAPGALDIEQPVVEEDETLPVQGEVVSPPAIGPDFSRWRHVWVIPLWIGMGITVLSGFLMFLAWQGSGYGLLFVCAWLPFLLGVGVMALAWSSRNLPWLHIRIQQKPGERPQRITISLPLPLGLIRLALRVFKDKIPQTGDINLEDMVMALKYVSPETPFSVDVDEGENGEHVQIYIG